MLGTDDGVSYFFVLMIRRPPKSTPFPYPTLFRSLQFLGITDEPLNLIFTPQAVLMGMFYSYLPFMILPLYRSEEPTSELQSRQYLVCRLLLEKKQQLSETSWPHTPPRSPCSTRRW